MILSIFESTIESFIMLSIYEITFGLLIILLSAFFFKSPLVISFLMVICFIALICNCYWDTIKSKFQKQETNLRVRRNDEINRVNNISLKGRNVRTKQRNHQLQYQNINRMNNTILFETSQNSSLDFGSGFNSSFNYSPTISPSFNWNQSYNFTFHIPYKKILPISQVGNFPTVKLTPDEERFTKKPVTIKIAPLNQTQVFSPQNTLERLTNASIQTSSFNLSPADKSGPIETNKIIEALKEKRKRTKIGEETEIDDSLNKNSNKRVKVSDSPQPINGILQTMRNTFKRSAPDYDVNLTKRYKYNEILSSYSSLGGFSKSAIKTANKRKTQDEERKTQDEETTTSKIMRNESPTENKISMKKQDLNEKITKTIIEVVNDDSSDVHFNELPTTSTTFQERLSNYSIPLHLHTMDDHERDQNKHKAKLKKLLDAIKEAKDPKDESLFAFSNSNLPQTSSISDVSLPEVSSPELPLPSSDISVAIVSSSSPVSIPEISLPEIPPLSIFTTSGMTTNVTNTLLSSPISSISAIASSPSTSYTIQSTPATHQIDVSTAPQLFNIGIGARDKNKVNVRRGPGPRRKR